MAFDNRVRLDPEYIKLLRKEMADRGYATLTKFTKQKAIEIKESSILNLGITKNEKKNKNFKFGF